MTAFYIGTAFLSVVFIFICIRALFFGNFLEKTSLAVSAFLSLGGAVICTSSYTVFQRSEVSEWASNAFSSFLSMTAPATLILLFLLCIAGLVKHKMKKVRLLLASLYSLSLLFVTAVFSLLCKGDSPVLIRCVCLFGMGEALFMQLSFVSDRLGEKIGKNGIK